jgi:hypothetical protein
MMRSLDQLLGRSTLDPSVRTTYEAGEVAQLLAEFDFPAAIRASLCAIEADTFEAFARQAYEYLLDLEGPDDAGPDPWPSQGLPDRPHQHRRRSRAA